MHGERKFKVVVAEDEPLIRENLIKKIGQCHEGFEVAGEAHNGDHAFRLIEELHPDVLITDIRMPVKDGLALLEETYYRFPHLKTVIVSGYDDFSYAKTAIRFGVKDYLLKPIKIEELRRVLADIYMQLDKERCGFESVRMNYSEHAAQEALAQDMVEYLRNHFAEQISVTEIARALHVQPPYAAKVFKKITGNTPNRYLIELRITHAQKLLTEYRDMEIKEISSIVGYEDQLYFSRIFKKICGVSPQEYRQKL